jgi:hypothetical protein
MALTIAQINLVGNQNTKYRDVFVLNARLVLMD